MGMNKDGEYLEISIILFFAACVGDMNENHLKVNSPKFAQIVQKAAFQKSTLVNMLLCNIFL